jgi:hypothetical protein
MTQSKLSDVGEINIECPGCHDLPERILSTLPFLARLYRYLVIRYLG